MMDKSQGRSVLNSPLVSALLFHVGMAIYAMEGFAV